MKKVLTILVVLALVCGAVFADDLPNQGAAETHTVKLHTTVGIVNPVFQLQATSLRAVAADDTDVTLAEAVSTNTATKFADGGAHDVADAIEAGDITKNAIAVSFDVNLLNAAKLVKVFDIELSATGFDVNKNGSRTTTAAPTPVLTPETITENGVEADEKVENSVFTATFNGTTCTAVKLATFALTYAKDIAVDPTSDLNQATYKSTVTMTVTAN